MFHCHYSLTFVRKPTVEGVDLDNGNSKVGTYSYMLPTSCYFFLIRLNVNVVVK